MDVKLIHIINFFAGEIWERVQDLLPALHSVPMVPGSQDAFQEDRGVSDLRKTEKRLPDLSLGLAVRPSSSGMYCILAMHVYVVSFNQIFISLRSKAKRGSGLVAGVQGFLFDDFSPIPSSELPK